MAVFNVVQTHVNSQDKLQRNFIRELGLTGNTVFLSWVNLMTILNALIIGVTIVVVAVPEGLPLAVTISLAYSVG